MKFTLAHFREFWKSIKKRRGFGHIIADLKLCFLVIDLVLLSIVVMTWFNLMVFLIFVTITTFTAFFAAFSIKLGKVRHRKI